MSVENAINLNISLKTPEGEINPNFSGAAVGETMPEAAIKAVSMVEGMILASQKYRSTPYELSVDRFTFRNGHDISWQELKAMVPVVEPEAVS